MVKRVTKSSTHSSHGGSRKGAGRPRESESGKTAALSLRISSDLRSRLEAERRLTRKKSLSLTVEALLDLGLKERQSRQSDDPIRAICYLITRLSEDISGALDRKKYNWRTNPFLYEAFKYAVIKVLDGIRPTGACEAPEVPDAYKFSGPTPEDTTDRLIYGGQFFDTPENRGRDVATWLLTDLFRNKESDLKEMKSLVHVWGTRRNRPSRKVVLHTRAGLSGPSILVEKCNDRPYPPPRQAIL